MLTSISAAVVRTDDGIDIVNVIRRVKRNGKIIQEFCRYSGLAARRVIAAISSQDGAYSTGSGYRVDF